MDKGFQDLGNAMESDKLKPRDEQILEWLSPKNRVFELHKDIRRPRTHDTGKWFLNGKKFQAWVEGDGPNFFFCYGKGKILQFLWLTGSSSRIWEVGIDVTLHSTDSVLLSSELLQSTFALRTARRHILGLPTFILDVKTKGNSIGMMWSTAYFGRF